MKKWSDMNSAERAEYLQDLSSKRGSTTKAFIGDLDTSYNGMKEKSKQLAAVARTTMARSDESPTQASNAYAEPGDSVRHRQPSTYPVTMVNQLDVFDTFSNMHITRRASDQTSLP